MLKKKKEFVHIALYLVVFFVILFIILFIIPDINLKVSNFFSSNQTIVGLKIMKVITFFGSEIVLLTLIFVIAIVLQIKKKYKDSFFYFFTTISGIILELFLKVIIQSQRPINPFMTDFSFPSGHTFMTLLIAGSLTYILWPRNKKVACTLLVFPIAVAFSRIYLNVHWLTDIIGSIILGLSWIILWAWILKVK